MTATRKFPAHPAPKLPPLYPKQREAIFCAVRYTLIEATTKAGKTAGCLIWLLILGWNEGKPGRNYWWVAPVIPQAKIAFRRLKRMLQQYDPGQVTWSCNETESRIDLRNGASIWFKGADHPDNLYGDDVYGAVIDEASRCKEDAWHAVRSTLTATRGPVKIIGNVRGRKNWAYEMARKAESGAQDMAYFKLTAYDAVAGGVLDAAEIEDAKRTLPAHVFKELFLAEPSDDGGNPFGLEAIRACVISRKSTAPAKVFGVDLAKSVDWTWVVGLDADGNECVSNRWQSDWEQTRRKVETAIGQTPSLIDSTGVGDPIVESICRTCRATEGFKFTSQSKQQIMEGLAAAIQQKRVGFCDPQLVNELETFEYEYTQSGVRYRAPEGLHDDGVCALALAVRQLETPVVSFESGFDDYIVGKAG